MSGIYGAYTKRSRCQQASEFSSEDSPLQTYCPVLIKEISTSKKTKTDYVHNGLTGKIRIRIGKMRCMGSRISPHLPLG